MENQMPYVNKPRPYKKEYEQEKARGEHPDRMERQRARRAVDKTGADKNGNGKADKREGKDIAHKKALSKGGSNKDGVVVQSASANRSFRRAASGALVSETSKRERKK
jgi:hypothetical protein